MWTSNVKSFIVFCPGCSFLAADRVSGCLTLWLELWWCRHSLHSTGKYCTSYFFLWYTSWPGCSMSTLLFMTDFRYTHPARACLMIQFIWCIITIWNQSICKYTTYGTRVIRTSCQITERSLNDYNNRLQGHAVALSFQCEQKKAAPRKTTAVIVLVIFTYLYQNCCEGSNWIHT